jgi:hypothetical protein
MKVDCWAVEMNRSHIVNGAIEGELEDSAILKVFL